MGLDHASDDESLTSNAAGQVGAAHETFDQFVERMIAEGASPEAATEAATGHFAFEAKRVHQGALLPGPTAQRWTETMFVMLGVFLAVLISVLFTAPAFHPRESEAESQIWVTVFLATFFPILVLMVGSGVALFVKEVRELRNGYTTLRWLTANSAEVRDSRGRVIPPGDRRLTSSAKYMHAFILVGSAFAVGSPSIWILRVLIQ